MTVNITLKTPSFTIESPTSGTSVSVSEPGTTVDVPPLSISIDYGTVLSSAELISSLPVRKIREVMFWAEALTFVKQIGVVPLDLDTRVESLELISSYVLVLNDSSIPIESLQRQNQTIVDILSIAAPLDDFSYIRMSSLPSIAEVTNPVVETLFLGASIYKDFNDQFIGLDNGLLRVSDYADPTYFAEDFVENSRTTFN